MSAVSLDLNEFEELEEAERRNAPRRGLNVWNRPLVENQGKRWNGGTEATRVAPTPVNSLEIMKEDPAVVAKSNVATDLFKRRPPDPALVEAIRTRNNTDGARALAREFGVKESRIWNIASRLRAAGLLEKVASGPRRRGPAPERRKPRIVADSASAVARPGAALITHHSSLSTSPTPVAIDLVLRVRVVVEVVGGPTP